MSLARDALRSTRGRIVIGAAVAYLAWQAWLVLVAPTKIAEGFPDNARRVNVLVTLPFTPERFHVLVFQTYGRVSGTTDNAVEVRGVQKQDLRALARPYWVRHVEPLQPGG